MRTQWTTKGNRDAGSSCSCDRGLHRYFRNFGRGGGFETPNPPPLRYATDRVFALSVVSPYLTMHIQIQAAVLFKYRWPLQQEIETDLRSRQALVEVYLYRAAQCGGSPSLPVQAQHVYTRVSSNTMFLIQVPHVLPYRPQVCNF